MRRQSGDDLNLNTAVLGRAHAGWHETDLVYAFAAETVLAAAATLESHAAGLLTTAL